MCINYKHCDGHSPIKMIVSAILLVGFILTDILLQSIIQEGKREQARMNLDQVKYCYNRSFENYGKEMALNLCTSKMKTSFTGDVYALELVEIDGVEKFKFIYENSKDTTLREDLYFTKESVGKYFKDWESGAKAIKTIALGKDSSSGVNVSYNFDGSPEWIEWKYVPDEADKTPIVIVQGTQSDEVMGKYTVYRAIGFGGVSLIVLILLISNSVNIRSSRNGRLC